jgi:hypothetical protein
VAHHSLGGKPHAEIIRIEPTRPKTPHGAPYQGLFPN